MSCSGILNSLGMGSMKGSSVIIVLYLIIVEVGKLYVASKMMTKPSYIYACLLSCDCLPMFHLLE